ncbi:cyclin-O [Eucyclogobius newberryi]|uniref:cyclin-O n=1 Tax=Eucyclogobius newberryi TaxID=166745 RepID=UPI003B5AA808
MVSCFPSDPQNAHKQRRADGTSSFPHTIRHRKQKLTCTLSDSGFEDELCLSPAPDALPQSGQLSWYRQYGDTGYKIQKEKETHFYPCKSLVRQPQLNAEARCKLVSWLIPVHQYLSLSFECCCLTVNIMDRFLSSTPVAADCFQLLGVTALLLASKQVEVCLPRVSDLLTLCCDAFTKEQLCNLECLILVRLNFRLCAPTLAFFLDCYINFKNRKPAAPLDRNDTNIRTSHCNKLAQKLCELSLADYSFSKYPPSLTARCALQLTSEREQAAQDPLHSLDKEWDSFVNESDSDSADSDSSDSSMSRVLMESSQYSLMQECTNNLRLLASLNQEALTML